MELKSNINPGRTREVLHLNQGDKGRKISFFVFDENAPYIFSNETVFLNGIKPDGRGLSLTAEVKSGTNEVVVTITEQTTVVAGQFEAELSIMKSDTGLRVGTSNFIIDVEKDPLGTTTVSDSEITAFQALLNKATSEAGKAEVQAGLASKSVELATTEVEKAKEQVNLAKNKVEECADQVARAEQEATKAQIQSVLSKSWAVGGTGQREGEDTDNAQHYANIAKQAISTQCVTKFNSRSGEVHPEAGDYTSSQISYKTGNVEDALDKILKLIKTPGDTINLSGEDFAGYITAGGTQFYFSVPAPLHMGVSKAKVTKAAGRIRQNGKYLFGQPTGPLANLLDESVISSVTFGIHDQILSGCVTFKNDPKDVVNNDVAAIQLSATIMLS